MNAVECLAAKRLLADWWGQDRWGLRSAEFTASQAPPEVTMPSAGELRDVLQRHIAASEVFHVTADMVDLAEGASLNMPGQPLRVDDSPTGCGFMVLDRPLLLPEDLAPTTGQVFKDLRALVGVSAVSWGPARDPSTGRPGLAVTTYIDWHRLRESCAETARKHMQVLRDLDDVDRRIAQARAALEQAGELEELAEIGDRGQPHETPEERAEKDRQNARLLRFAETWPQSRFLFAGVSWWPWGGSPTEPGGSFDVDVSTPHWGRVLLALWSLMQQPLVSAVREPAPRAEVKRLRRADLPDTGVTVITLRRKVAPSPLPGERLVEWSHRWVVRGHWRMQPYRDGVVRRIFIAPFVKGPDDKPLRAVERVYELRR